MNWSDIQRTENDHEPIDCPGCKAEIDPSADICPECGHVIYDDSIPEGYYEAYAESEWF